MTVMKATHLLNFYGAVFSQTFQYDGFGNLTAQLGSPNMQLGVDQSTNRAIGMLYDANGNFDGGGWKYDVENPRVRQVAGDNRFYSKRQAGPSDPGPDFVLLSTLPYESEW